ncbi:MAG: lysylphosphatidylglycerol synthase transmembrane domain-containing protein [Streptosporangiaceae bacterium]
MRLSWRRPPARSPAAPVGLVPSGALTASGGRAPDEPASSTAALVVEDQLEPRIRMPTDLLRCFTSILEVAILVGLALLAEATAKGFEFDVVQHVPRGLVAPLHTIAFIALLVLPVALAVRQVLIGQLRQLIEAVGIGLIAGGVAVGCAALLRLGSLDQLYRALVRSGNEAGATALDPYLTGLAAYLTVIGLSGRPRWRTWFWLAISFYCLTSLALAHDTSTVLSLLITLALGAAVGSGLRYLTRTTSERPTAVEIAAALSLAATPVVEIRRVADSRTENRRYAAVSREGERLDVTVFDRDQQTADFLYRLYRRLRLTSQASRSSPLTVSRTVERRALLAYAVEDAGVPTPKLRAVLRVGPEAAAIATRHCTGTTLAELPYPPSDQILGSVWDAVLQLHRRRVTHRSLTPEHILVAAAGRRDTVMLLDPGDGDVAASDLQLRLDLAQLTAAMALLVGPERAASLARKKLGQAMVTSLVPLLQPVVLHRSTRADLRRRKDVLPALRKGLIGSAPEPGPELEQLERIRPRRVVTLVAAVIAAYLVIGQLGRRNFLAVLRQSDWRWILAGLALSALTYAGASWSLSGFVLEKLRFARTFLAQLAGTFVTLVAPAAVGGVALNIRYLHKAKVAPADAGSSVAVSQVIAFALHMTLLVIFIAITGGSHQTPFRPPGWAYFALAAIAAVALGVLAVPAGRRLIRSRLAPTLGQVIPRLLDIAQRPAKLAEGIGGALLVTFGYIFCLQVSVLAVGAHAAFFAVAVVFLTGQAIGSVVPTPGGLGAIEIALSGALTTIAHVPVAFALSAVLLFRLLTFWLPIPIGYVAIKYLQRQDAL